MTAFDAFSRQCIAWPAAIIGAVLTEIAGAFLRFAAWMMDFNDENGDWTE